MYSITQELSDSLHNAWANHASNIYDYCTTHFLEHPCNAIEFLTDSRKVPPSRDYSVQQCIVGTQKQTENQLVVYQVFLPAELDNDEYEYLDIEDVEAFEGYPQRFSEIGALTQRYQTVYHDGPVINIKAMPQQPHIVASRGPRPGINVFDLSRRRATPETTAVKPDARFKGHRKEGYPMEWSHIREGAFVSGANDGTVAVWDAGAETINKFGTMDTIEFQPVQEFKGHSDTVSGVSWHADHDCVFTTCSHDRYVMLWDTRAGKPQQSEQLHRSEILDVDMHPSATFILATASADRSVRVWDLRNFVEPVMELRYHREEVRGVEWAPFNDSVLLSYGKDRMVCCWDMSKEYTQNLIQAELEKQRRSYEAAEGSGVVAGERTPAPDTLLFAHLGHTAGIRCARWSQHEEDDWTVASVDENNVVQFWSPRSTVYHQPVSVAHHDVM